MNEGHDYQKCSAELNSTISHTQTLDKIYQGYILIYCNVLILLIVFLLGVFLIYKGRLKSFEAKILSCMLLYKLIEFIVAVAEKHGGLGHGFVFIIFTIAMNTLPLIYHWLFASQYLKTCSLMPSFIKKTLMLLQIYQEKTERENKIRPLSASFLQRHDDFDLALKLEKQRIERIKRKYRVADLTFSIFIISLATVLIFIEKPYQQGDQLDKVTKKSFIQYCAFLSIYDIGTGIILAWSAFYLGYIFNKLSGRKPKQTKKLQN